MPKKSTSIPVNSFIDGSKIGIAIERIQVKDLRTSDEAMASAIEEGHESHRHDSHSFFLLENGTVQIEIDFRTYKITGPSVIYIHPNQVHHTIASEDVIVSSWAISNENLNPDYLKLLEDITPAKPLVLANETFSIISETVFLCLKLFDRKHDKLYHPLVKDSCNALVALVLSQYLDQAKSLDKISRVDSITKAFKELLDRNYTRAKRPTEYAQKLNISTPYLNECVKNTTGYSVSYHIQQRVILEAKRLLSYSDKSVKEIAAELGYDDYPYFSRLFTKVTGMAALAFRNTYRD